MVSRLKRERKPAAAPDVRIPFTHTLFSLAVPPRRAADLLSAEAPSESHLS